MKKILSFFLLIFCVSLLSAQSGRPGIFDPDRSETYINAYVSSDMLKQVCHNFSVDNIIAAEHNCYTVRICLSHNQYDEFLALGIPFTFVSPLRANVRMAHNYAQLTNAWDRYPTYGTYTALMDTFQRRFPNICKIDTILGHTDANHKLLVAHISNNLQDKGDKPSFFYTSTMHGDEPVGYYVMLRLIDDLLNNYESNSQVQNIIDNVDLWICPLENPDGTYRNHNDSLNESPYSTRHNYSDIDLNRSYPIAGESFNENGPYPDEVQAMLNFSQAHHFTMSANFHGGAEVFNYPWDTWSSYQRTHADDDWWQYVGNNFASTCHDQNFFYMRDLYTGVTEGADWYSITGSRQDCHNYFLGCREVTIEVSSDKVVSSSNLYKYWNYLRPSLLNYIEESLNGFRGVVLDSITGQPIEATIFINNHDKYNSQVQSHLPAGDYHRPIKAGTYSVTYSAENYYPKTITVNVADGECIVKNVQLVPTYVGINEIHDTPAFVIYPNPTHGYLYITSMMDPPKQFDFFMYDYSGRLIHQTKVDSGTSSLNISSLPAGIYIIDIMDNGSVIYSTKIIKE
ncbi:MAG: T9SS type A sorting domain-containing protein [Bacteroidales bacterium]|nr:T9SS type A sorting domain-containing protein [Bacteroidales bacterium]